jgi:hypothetical protein
MSSNFLDDLLEKVSSNHLDSTQLLRIQMGREIVFKGILGKEPEIDKLTESRIQLLQSVMKLGYRSSADVGSDAMYTAVCEQQTVADVYDDLNSELIQAYEDVWGENSFEYPDHSHKTVDEFLRDLGKQVEQPTSEPIKGTVNIDLGGDRIFRYAKGEVEVNAIEQAQQTQAIDSVPIEDYRTRLIQIAQAILQANPELVEEIATIRERYESDAANQDDLASSVYLAVISALDADQSGIGQEFYEQFLPEMKATRHEAWIESGIKDLGSAVLGEVSKIQEQHTPDLSELSMEVVIENLHTYWEQAEQAENIGDNSATLPASAIARIEMQDVIPAANQTWLDQEMGLEGSAFVEELQNNGKESARERFSTMQQLSRATLNRALADSITLASQALDKLGDSNQFKCLYETESYVIRTDESKKSYSVSLKGEEVFVFQRTPIGVKVTTNTLPGINQWDILVTGQHLLKTDIQRSFAETKQQFAQIVQGLGNLAPKGSHEAVHEMAVRQAVGVVKQILSSPLAKLQGKQSTYSGENYEASGDQEQMSLSAQDGRGKILTVSQTLEGEMQIQSRMLPKDTQQISKFGQALQKFQQGVKTAAAKVKQTTER